jgi:CheY-like chemotaxis protein
MSETFWIEIVRIVPTIFMLILISIGLIIVRRPVLKLLEKITHLQAFGVDVNFKEVAKENLRAAIKSYTFDPNMPDDKLQEIINKAESLQDRLKGARILWVDDTPLANANIHHFLNQFGVIIDNTTRTDEAIAALRWSANAYKVIVTDMNRDGNGRAGLDLLEGISTLQDEMRTKPDVPMLDIPPVIVFVNENKPELGIPKGALKITDRVDELLTVMFEIVK